MPGRPYIDLKGQRFGRWVVLSFIGGTSAGIAWHCRCDCGNVRPVLGRSLRAGVSQSCGCLHRDGRTTHGRTRTREFKIWQGLVQRCTNPNSTGYRNYGKRGIKVCRRWRDSFEAFFADMGAAPSRSHTLDRHPDNNGNYEPGNCRWATKKEQARNARHNRRLTFNGESLAVSEWAERLGLAVPTVFSRLRKGWPLHRVLSPSVDAARSHASHCRRH
jgi:hypothetical protein